MNVILCRTHHFAAESNHKIKNAKDWTKSSKFSSYIPVHVIAFSECLRSCFQVKFMSKNGDKFYCSFFLCFFITGLCDVSPFGQVIAFPGRKCGSVQIAVRKYMYFVFKDFSWKSNIAFIISFKSFKIISDMSINAFIDINEYFLLN